MTEVSTPDARPAAAPLPLVERADTPRRPWLWAVAIAALVFAALAPTLAWQEFSSGSENLLVETVLEIRRDDVWLVPTLQGQPRTQKPPLPAWITAAGVRQSTVDALWQPDLVRRDAAYRQLAWEVRRSALLFACPMLVAVYGLGRAIAGPRIGLAAALVCGTTGMFLRFGRYATTDVHLALWVTVANVALAGAVLYGRWWLGCLVGGAALGLAMMSKGPVCLVQTVVPVAAFVGWRAWARRRAARDTLGVPVVRNGPGDDRVTAGTNGEPIEPASRQPPDREAPAWRGGVLLPILAGVLLLLAIGLPWYAYLLARNPALADLWWREVTRKGATDMEPDPAYSYLAFLPYMLPWTMFLVIGLIGSIRSLLARAADERLVLALFLTAVPILIMTLSQDRKERYLLPMTAPAAVLAAWGVREAVRTAAGGGRVVRGVHWAVMAAAVVALPVVGAIPNGPMQTRAGGPWYGWGFAVAAATGVGLIVAAGFASQRRRPAALLVSTALAMLAAQAVAMWGYRNSRQGLSEMKPLADAIWSAEPDAAVYYRHNARAPSDLAIYLDRITPQVWSFEAIPTTGDRLTVAAVVQRRRAAPVAVPEGATLIGETSRGEDMVRAYLLPGPAGAR